MTIRKTYELPAPSKTSDNFSIWHTDHSVEIDGAIDNDGTVIHDRSRGTIHLEMHEGEDLALDHNEARRVALALLAAVEEAKRARDKEMGK